MTRNPNKQVHHSHLEPKAQVTGVPSDRELAKSKSRFKLRIAESQVN
jgi:hypothetical protein